MYNDYLVQQVKVAEQLMKNKKPEKPKPSPCIILLHELFDALPIFSFEFREGRWHEHVVRVDKLEGQGSQGCQLRWALSAPDSENVRKVLQPDKIFKGVQE